MKWFTKLTVSMSLPRSGFLERRRDRQRSAPLTRSFDLAAAHVRLLLTMAAADGFVEQAELDEVARVIDRLPLAPGDAARLHELVGSLDRSQLQVHDLELSLAQFDAFPRFASGLVVDLARMAAVGGEEHARQVLVLEEICERLDFTNPLAQAPVLSDDEPVALVQREHLDYARQLRLRESVLQALERSYARS